MRRRFRHPGRGYLTVNMKRNICNKIADDRGVYPRDIARRDLVWIELSDVSREYSILKVTERQVAVLIGYVLVAALGATVVMHRGREPIPAMKDTSWVRAKYLDLSYASHSPAEKLDLYLPNEGQGPFPLIVAIHGGAFLVGDKRDSQQNAAIEALRHGYAVASINYRFSSEAIFPAAVEDVKAAIRFLRANAGRYRLDPRRVAAWGDSAGGYLAVMAGVTGETSGFDDASLGNPGQPSAVQAVVDWFGPIVFTSIDAEFRQSGKGQLGHGGAASPESKFLGRAVDTAPPALLRRANPLSYLGPHVPPFLIQHGDTDPLVPTQQSLDLGAAVKPYLKSGQLEIDVLPGVGHGGAAFEAPANLAKIFTFLGRVLPTAGNGKPR